MSTSRKPRTRATIGLLSGLSITSAASAQTATFQIDPSASSLSVSGTAFELPILTQGPGSLTTTYQGPLLVNLGPSTISFPGGSAVAANNSGNWQPDVGGIAGTAPANYGGRVNLGIFGNAYAAVRGTVFDATTLSPFALAGANSASFSSAIDLAAIAGAIDYNSVLSGIGTAPVSGDPATNASASSATLNIVAGASGTANAAITVPVALTLITDLNGLGEGVFNFAGSMTARATAIAGDANFDGRVNTNDFTVLAANFGQSDKGWLSGDFNFDGVVNTNDFSLLAGNFGAGASSDVSAPTSAMVPEPGCFSLIGAVVTAVSITSRRRRR